MSVVSHKCPNCGSSLNYDPNAGTIKCKSCGSEFTKEEMKKYSDQLATEDSPKNTSNQDGLSGQDMSGMTWDGSKDEEISLEGGVKHYTCPSCGGQIIGDGNLAATTCPYCENPALLSDNLSGILKPDLVIPFKISKDKVVETLHQFYGKRILLPSKFQEKNRIEKVAGIYVPFWLYDANIHADMHFEGTKIRTWISGDYEYTETSYYDIYRQGEMSFEKVPVDGSEQMEDDTMDSIEPFDYSDFKDFDGMYLAGFMADKYTVDQVDASPRANLRINNSAEIELRNTISGYSFVRTVGSSINTTGEGKVQYAFMPVWLLNTKYKDKIYTFAMNGQTGKMVGSLPVDKVKAVIFLLVLLVIFFGGSFLIEYIVKNFF